MEYLDAVLVCRGEPVHVTDQVPREHDPLDVDDPIVNVRDNRVEMILVGVHDLREGREIGEVDRVPAGSSVPVSSRFMHNRLG